MGYSTDFQGSFNLNTPLTESHKNYLHKFSETRRMKRDPKKAAELPDPIRVAAGLKIGPEAAYFVGGAGWAGQDRDASILDYNREPSSQPGLWCQWVPNEDGDEIVWDEGEKFYNYVEWLRYLITHFLKPWGYVLNGEVEWQGEESDDFGKILVENNNVIVKRGWKVFD